MSSSQGSSSVNGSDDEQEQTTSTRRPNWVGHNPEERRYEDWTAEDSKLFEPGVSRLRNVRVRILRVVMQIFPAVLAEGLQFAGWREWIQILAVSGPYFTDMALTIALLVYPFSAHLTAPYGLPERSTLARALWLGEYRFVGVPTVVLIAFAWSTTYTIALDWTMLIAIATTLRVAVALMLYVALQSSTYDDTRDHVLNWSFFALLFAVMHAYHRRFHTMNRLLPDRRRLFLRGRPVFHESSMGSTVNRPELDQATGLVMEIASPTDRMLHRRAIRHQLSKKQSAHPRSAAWHQPRSVIDSTDPISREKLNKSGWPNSELLAGPLRTSTDTIPQNFHEARHNGPDDTLFSRCYCCIDDAYTATTRDSEQIVDLPQSWINGRMAVMSEPVNRHSLFENDDDSTHRSRPSSYNTDGTQLNFMCSQCEVFCAKSELLKSLSRYPNLLEYLFHASEATPLVEELFEHYSSLKTLLASAYDGCHLCTLMVESLSFEQRAELLDQCASEESRTQDDGRAVEDHGGTSGSKIGTADQRIFVKIVNPSYFANRHTDARLNSSLLLVPHFGYARVPRRWLGYREVQRAQSLQADPTLQWGLELVAPIEIRAAVQRGSISMDIQESTASESTINLIQTWLSQHDHYSDPQSLDLSGPSRLLDLRGAGNEPATIRICQVSLEVRHRYVALSYVWRENETNTLTSQTSTEDDIPIQDLAATIREAILVARKLGFRYLWIDALCIRQDSAEDKAKELPKMASIYANAELILAAASAADSSEGFIREQNPRAVTPCLISSHCLDVGWGAARGGIFALPPRSCTYTALDEIEYSRLRSRAWVFQEERLARRTVYFTNSQVILHCNTCNKTTRQLDFESGFAWSNGPLTDYVWQDAVSTYFKAWFLFGDFKDNTPDLDHLNVALFSDPQMSASEIQTSVWFDLVERYTQCFLSNKSDRLRAIDGLAKRLETEIKKYEPWSDYSFGLFDSNSTRPASMLWYVSDDLQERPRFGMPSWSWASVEGVIKNNSTGCYPITSGATIGSFSSQSGVLNVRAKIRPALVKHIPEEPRRFYTGHHEKLDISSPNYHNQFIPVSYDVNAGPEVQALCALDGSSVGYFVPDTVEILPIHAGQPTESSAETVFYEIYCLRIVVQPHPEKDRSFKEPWVTRGLALVRWDSDPDSLRYRRVGYFELSRDHEGPEYSNFQPDIASNRVRTRWVPRIDKSGFFKHATVQSICIH